MLTYKRIHKDDEAGIDSVFEILRACGEDMFARQGLTHWKDNYPASAIQSNCDTREVYLAYLSDQPVATYQLEYAEDHVVLSKFAVLPEKSGGGLGSIILKHIAQEAASKNAKKIKLDVYDQSKHAIAFYRKNGFEITGSAPTRRFTIILMEKTLI